MKKSMWDELGPISTISGLYPRNAWVKLSEAVIRREILRRTWREGDTFFKYPPL